MGASSSGKFSVTATALEGEIEELVWDAGSGEPELHQFLDTSGGMPDLLSGNGRDGGSGATKSAR